MILGWNFDPYEIILGSRKIVPALTLFRFRAFEMHRSVDRGTLSKHCKNSASLVEQERERGEEEKTGTPSAFAFSQIDILLVCCTFKEWILLFEDQKSLSSTYSRAYRFSFSRSSKQCVAPTTNIYIFFFSSKSTGDKLRVSSREAKGKATMD